jgi:hypothetical protein
MTMPEERTRAVVETRKFLRLLAIADDVTVRGRLSEVAGRLLRHYPLDVDLEVSAAALPGVWAAPEN